MDTQSKSQTLLIILPMHQLSVSVVIISDDDDDEDG